MILQSGSSVGAYEIVEPLGKGGMGEVYRARDPRLGRDVAIKILPGDFADDEERLLRFEREARLLASVSHPNIAVVHGFDAVEGQRYIVLEFIDGETLANRLKRGPLHIDEVIDLGKQIADALAAAHDKGVIHRDLKPGNVMVNDDGAVKVLDFGLARTTGDDAGSASNALNSPTITAHYTKPGVVLGSAAYMSPEQARGRPVDKRSDIWSFGVILFECLTGRMVFAGETPSDSMGAIIHKEPDWGTLPPGTPQIMQQLLRRCLAKDRKQRLHDIADARIELEEVRAQLSSGFIAQATTAPYPTRGGGGGWRAACGVLTLLLIAAVAALVMTPRAQVGSAPTAVQATALRIASMEQLTDHTGYQFNACLSPNGKQFVYVDMEDGDTDVFLQRVGGEKRINLTADHNGHDIQPAFSPDGERIAYVSEREGGGIFVMGATGESPRRITTAGYDPAWSPDGTRLAYVTELVTDAYSRMSNSPLWIVDIASGKRTRMAVPDAVKPMWSPDGRRIAYWAATNGQRDIWTIAADDPQAEAVAVTDDAHTDWEPSWSADGREMMFISDRGGSPDVWQIDIDPASGAARGAARPLTAGVASVVNASLSGDGQRMAIGIARSPGKIVRWSFDHDGQRHTGEPETLLSSAHALIQMDISPDRQWITYRTFAPREDIFVMRTDGTGRRRLTDDIHRDRGPRWSPDGKWLLFYSNRSGVYAFWVMRPDGTDMKQITNPPQDRDANTPFFMPDGRTIVGVFTGDKPGTGFWKLEQPLEEFTEFVQPTDRLIEGFIASHVSPDGRYLSGFLQPQGYLVIAAYDLQEDELMILDGFPGEFTPMWLRDGWMALRSSDGRESLLWNVVTDERQVWADPPPRGELVLVEEDLFLSLQKPESDIWLLSLERE